MAGSVFAVSSASRRLEGKVALITGGARGIGESMARLFSKHGAKLVIADVQDEVGRSLCSNLSSSSIYIHCDVRKEEHVEAAMDAAMAEYKKLDIVVHNAGIIGESKFNIADQKLSDFENVIGVNLVGAFLSTKHAARVMIPARRGSIITTASVCSTIGGIGSHAYTSSKHGMVGLMKNAAVELGQYGIRVNSVSPYVVLTKMAKNFMKADSERFTGKMYSNLETGMDLEEEDVAEAALYLASDESKYVSGHNLVVDGGFTAVNRGFANFGQPS